MNKTRPREDVLNEAAYKRGTQNARYGHVGHHREEDLRPEFPQTQGQRALPDGIKPGTIGGHERGTRKRFEVLFPVGRKDFRMDEIRPRAGVQDDSRGYHCNLRTTNRNGHIIVSVFEETEGYTSVLASVSGGDSGQSSGTSGIAVIACHGDEELSSSLDRGFAPTPCPDRFLRSAWEVGRCLGWVP